MDGWDFFNPCINDYWFVFKEIEQYFKTKLRHYSEFLLLTFELKYKPSFYTRGKRTKLAETKPQDDK